MAGGEKLIAAYVAGLILLFIFIKIFYTPLKLALRLFASSLIGGVILYGVNVAGSIIGIQIGINIYTAMVAGVFGIPGISMMLMLQISI